MLFFTFFPFSPQQKNTMRFACAYSSAFRRLLSASARPSTSSRIRRRTFSVSSSSSESSKVNHEGAVKVSHILVDATEPGKALLSEFQTLLDGEAETFEGLATMHSKCPSSSRGGNLGYITRGQTVAEFERVAFSTPINEVAFATTPFGHHLIKVLDAKESGQAVPQMQSIRVDEVKQYVDSESFSEVNLIDCREEHEFAIAKVDGFKLYPLSRAEKWQMTIEMDVDPEKKTIVMCHGGIRSAKVCQMLLSLGFEDVHNVVGGIDAYSSIDKSVPRY